MQRGEEPKVDDAIKEVAALLAAAYKRRARIRLVHTKSATTWCRPAALSRPCAPTVGFVAARCYAGRPVVRSSQPLSHGH
jgi:hypothetical protein